MRPNNPNNLKAGDEVYSVSLGHTVIIHTLGSSSAYCVDTEDTESDGYLLQLSDLRPVDWDADTILRREG